MDTEVDNGVPSKFGKVCIRKERRKRQKIIAIELFFDFAKNTTLHGLRYVAERGLSLLERLFWLLTFIISVSLCFYLIHKVWLKWQTYPVLVTFNEQLFPVNMVPFPSVTICPQWKCKKSVYKYSEELDEIKKNMYKLNEYNTKDLEKLEDVNLICDHGRTLLPRNVSDSSVVDNILEVSPDLRDVFFYCKWRGKYMSCDLLFNKVLAREGVCYNFNSLSSDEIFRTDNNTIQTDYRYLHNDNESMGWSIENGYSTSTRASSYPHRGRENGASPDLTVILSRSKSDNDIMCNMLNRGYKIYMHNPADMPHESLYYYAAVDDQVSSLAVKVTMLNTSDSLKGYPSDIRQCYFSTERRLRYFRIYTASNCELECHSNFTFEKCKCVGFSMPHSDSRSICTMRMQSCMKRAINQVAKVGLATACSCLPLCDNVEYDAEILKTDFKFKNYISNVRKSIHLPVDNDTAYSKVDIFFKESRFVSTRRSELFGNVDFLANCGGLLGLFLGFSFLSLVEMFYFLTIRLWCSLKRDLKNEKAERKQSAATKFK